MQYKVLKFSKFFAENNTPSSFYPRSKDKVIFVENRYILLPKVEGCGPFCQKPLYPSTRGRRIKGLYVLKWGREVI